MHKWSVSKGFTLIEVLITLSLVTILSVVALNALTPWLLFKQSLDTDRKLQDMRQALTSAYSANAMVIDAQAPSIFLTLVSDPAIAGSACTSQEAALTGSALSGYLTEGGVGAAKDGFASPLCFFITTPAPRDVEGVRIAYRMIAIVSAGHNGIIDEGTAIDPVTGQLTLGGDDRGVVVNGYTIQYAKYRDTLDRMNRLAILYENYFTTRFLNTADRDVSRSYFYKDGPGGDLGGSIAATNGWTPALTAFATALGVSPVDATSAYETLNTIEVANNTETITVLGQTTSVRSPASLASGATPPYTALLRAKLPGAPDNYIVRAVVGNY